MNVGPQKLEQHRQAIRRIPIVVNYQNASRGSNGGFLAFWSKLRL